MASKKILLADDSLFMRRIINTILKKHGFDVVGEAVDGVDAVQKYKVLRPDLLIMDITMPKMTGINALVEIMREFPQAKVIMCSAMGQRPFVEEAISHGACGFIVKPVNEKDIIAVISRSLGI